ncbi:MAG: CHAT domain-containing protein [Scytonema hyalinum WJT4-NPBG1]|jgi:hypothetical protein|nr:CHAT domain-containing protein [Scytonema hyalinum WJT4-NPBG1]
MSRKVLLDNLNNEAILPVLSELTSELRASLPNEEATAIQSEEEARLVIATLLEILTVEEGTKQVDPAAIISDDIDVETTGRRVLEILLNDEAISSEIEDLIANPPEDLQLSGVETAVAGAVILGALVTWLQTKIEIQVSRKNGQTEFLFEFTKPGTDTFLVKEVVSEAFVATGVVKGSVRKKLFTNHPKTLRVTSSQSPLESSAQPQKILILAAIPHGLRLDREIREISSAIQRAARQDLFEIRIRTAVRPQDIRRAIAEERPEIVHFCGHGLEDGSLLLEDEAQNNKPVPPEGLALLFKLHADYVNCVLLNACYSAKPAHAISQHINYAIGMNQPIGDKAAIMFAQGFYDGLCYENPDTQDVIQRAFDEGLIALKLEDFSQGQIPVLKNKLFLY